jgi:hypothetical protein
MIKLRMTRCVEHVSRMGRNKMKEISMKPRLRWKDSIKMDLREIGWDAMDWINWLRRGTSGGFLRKR